MKSFVAVLALIALGSGCGYTNNKTSSNTGNPGTSPSAAPGTVATYSQVSQQILQPLCVSCHGSGGTSPDLSSYAGFATNTRYVVPGNPNNSLIYTITASGQMPQGGPALTSDQQNLLSSWIANGALND